MDQDWKPTIIRKSGLTGKDARSSSAVNKALAAGQKVETHKRHQAGTNKPTSDVNMSKLETDNESLKVKSVDPAVSKAIQRARQQLGKTQQELATEINERVQVVTDYESSSKKTVPSQQVLAKLERALKVRLRGSNIGAPL